MTALRDLIDRVSAYADAVDDHRPVWELTPHGQAIQRSAEQSGLGIDVVPTNPDADAGEHHEWHARLVRGGSYEPLAVAAGRTQLQAVDELVRSPVWRRNIDRDVVDARGRPHRGAGRAARDGMVPSSTRTG